MMENVNDTSVSIRFDNGNTSVWLDGNGNMSGD